ncbi:hypothetical protein GC173_18600 [bacterium]|nr:hypothetical protein [bacterium]
MKKCPGCGFVNTPERTRCLKCNALLESRALPTIRESAVREGHGIQILAPIRRILYRVSLMIWRDLPENVPHRWVWTAALMAMLPGGGAWYNHQPIKAGIFATTQVALWALFLITFFQPWNDWPALALAAWMFYAMADGFVTANRLNGAHWGLRYLGAMWFAMMFMAGALVFLTNFLGQAFFLTTTIRTDVQRPGFLAGDKVFVLTTAIAPKPKAGTIIYYDPGRYVLLRKNPMYGTDDTVVVNDKTAMGVVTATEGQVLSTGSDGVIRVDGVPVRPGLLPSNPNGSASVNARVPKGHYGVLITHGAFEGGAFALGAAIKGQGGVYGLEYPTPRDVGRVGWALTGYEEAVMMPAEKVWGTAVFRYYPPERRAWWGFDGPLWHEAPSDYPRAD